jgi:protein tyrosine phosphatase
MLTNEMEEGKKKCHQYFPQDKDKSVQFEQYRVSLKFVETSAATITRGLVLYYVPTGEMREIMHIQYIDWVDHGIPDDPQPFISFLHMVKSLKYKFDQSIPIVVHCSAGVGRSGVLVLSDMLTHTYDNGEVS